MKKLLSIFIIGCVLFSLTSCDEPEQNIVSDEPVDLDSLIQKYPDSVALLVERGNKLRQKHLDWILTTWKLACCTQKY